MPFSFQAFQTAQQTKLHGQGWRRGRHEFKSSKLIDRDRDRDRDHYRERVTWLIY